MSWSNLAVTYPDVELMAKGHLVTDLADEDCTVSLGIPTSWETGQDPHVSVTCDGTPIDLHPVAQQSTLRITVWADGATEAKRLANLAHGLLLARGAYKRLTGLLTAHDDNHDAELASFTLRATVRSTPIP